MRRNLTYPKDGDDKVRDSNKQLRMEVKRLRKDNERLRQELANIVKPVRKRREEPSDSGEPAEKYEDPKLTKDQWRRKFVAEYKPRINKALKETK